MRSKGLLSMILFASQLSQLRIVASISLAPLEELIPKLFPKEILVRLCEDFRPSEALTVKSLGKSGAKYIPPLDPSNVSERLDSFISALVGFVPTTGFDIERFKNSTAELEEEISEVEMAVSREIFHEIFVFERLKNCRALFVSMKVAADKMSLHDATGLFSGRCIYDLLDLHIMALTLESSFNLVDFSVRQRESIILGLHCKFVSTTDRYRRLGVIKKEFNDPEFWFQAKNTDHAIAGLKPYMQNFEQWGDCSL